MANETLTKTAAVKEALAQGITSPTAISEHVLKTYGLVVSPGHVSTIKGSANKKTGGTGRKRGRPVGSKTKTTSEPAANKPASSAKHTGLSPEDLLSLNDMARRAGGFSQLRAYLEVLGSLR